MSSNVYTWVARAIVLLTLMPVHECSHGYAAYLLGDDTARRQGRLTLNPFAHLDLLGSALLIFSGFGWAKPVQVDARNFKHPKRDMALTSLAGPLSNVLLSLLLMVVLKLVLAFAPPYRDSTVVYAVLVLLSNMIYVSLYLAVFNLLPVPPLDGAKIFGAVLPDRYYFSVMRYERFIALLLFALIFTGVLSRPLSALAGYLYDFLDLVTQPINRLFG